MSERLQVLLLGPAPPPHGGISVHVATARRLLERSGAECALLDTSPPGDRGSWRERPARLARTCRDIHRHAARGWWVHLHTNGHNPASWLLALLFGVAAGRSPMRLLTIHSGMAAEWIGQAPPWRRALLRLALGRFSRVICVNARIRRALLDLGIDEAKLEVAPAYLPDPGTLSGDQADRDADHGNGAAAAVEGLRSRHLPLLATALFFRPEYGFPVLLDALEALRARHPDLGCMVLGGGRGESREERDARRELVRRGMDGWVHLIGDVPHEVCLAAFSHADVFVRPTLEDGDAISVREAIALGVPVVASDVGARPPEALLFPPGDAAALAVAVERALAAPRRAPSEVPAPGLFEEFLALYRPPLEAGR